MSPLLTEIDLATHLGISRDTLRDWRQHGKGPKFIKLGGTRFARIRYRQQDVDAFLQASEIPTKPAQPAKRKRGRR